MKTCILTVILNEQDYLEDFIRYHIDLGIDTLYIFEDIGSTSHYDICSKYDKVVLKPVLDLFEGEEKGKILKRKLDGEFVQFRYMKAGLLWLRDNFDYDWCFAIDIDEYITPTEPFPSLLSDFSDKDGILLYWKNFGASGMIKKPIYDKPLYEIYTEPCGYTSMDWKYRHITKMAYNLKRLREEIIVSTHYSLGNWVRADFGVHRTDPPCLDRLYLRHYITKSYEEYIWKLNTRGMFCKNHRKIDDFFEMNNELKNILQWE